MESEVDVTLVLAPDSGEVADDAWQEECRGLAAALRQDPSLEVRPLPGPTVADGARGALAISFATLALRAAGSDASTAVASGIWETLTAWLRRRRGCSCTIKTADGSEFTFTNLTKAEAIAMLSAHLRRSRART